MAAKTENNGDVQFRKLVNAYAGFECVLAAFYAVVSHIYFFYITFYTLPKENQQLVGAIVGIMIYANKDVLIWAFKTAKAKKELEERIKNKKRRSTDSL